MQSHERRSSLRLFPLVLRAHGAGAQRSDPKDGDPARFPHGMGPQGDVIRILNYARAVRFITPFISLETLANPPGTTQ